MNDIRGCDQCGAHDEGRLYGCIDGVWFCSGCWKKAGRPFPKTRADMSTLHNAEVAARAKMSSRGGADRYRVRAGKA